MRGQWLKRWPTRTADLGVGSTQGLNAWGGRGSEDTPGSQWIEGGKKTKTAKRPDKRW